MSDETTQAKAHPVTRVARDLTAILDLYERLASQAEAQASHPLMPGGPAMVALGHVANMEAWENRQQATERYGEHPDERLRRAYTSAEDEDPDEHWSAFQLIEFWSEAWRREHDAEYDMRPTIASEVAFVRWALDWAWDNEHAWDDFAADINRARVKLEDILHEGKRHERSRIVCDRCDDGPRLLVFRGVADDCSDDRYKCPACKVRMTPEDAQRAHAKMLRSSSSERWVAQADAIGTLKAQGRPERTVRAWLAEGEGEAYCDPTTHQVWVWWPDLWRKHLATPTRARNAAS